MGTHCVLKLTCRYLTKLFCGNRSELVTERPYESWYLSGSNAFKGCEISPDGSLVAYWTDVKVSLYTSQSLPSEGSMADPAAEYSLEISDCIWKSIALTKTYLIAATTGVNFQVRISVGPFQPRLDMLILAPSKCYIFNLRQGTAVDANLDHRCRVTLPRPEITKLAT